MCSIFTVILNSINCEQQKQNSDESAAVEEPMVRFLHEWLSYLYPGLTHERLIFAILAVIFVIITCKNTFDLARMRWVRRFSTRIANEFRSRMFRVFLGADYFELTKRGRGAIVQNMEVVSSSVQSSVTSTATLIHSIVYVVTILALLIYISWWVTAFIGILGFFGTYFMRKALENPAHKVGIKNQNTFEQVSKLVVDSIDGARIVKTQNAQELLQDRLEELQRPLIGTAGRMSVFNGLSHAFFEIYSFLLIIAIMGIVLIMPSVDIGLPQLAALIIAKRRMQPNISNFNSMLVGMSYSLRQIEIADEVLNKMPIENSGDQKLVPGSYDYIAVKDVSFYYQQTEERYVLQDVSFELRSGEVTALVGATGAGKSTLVDLLVRLYDPVIGRIEAGTTDIREIDLSVWRDSIGYVSQDTYLFNASIRDNIAMWKNFGEDEVQCAAKAARLHDFITTLPEGYDTIVGDRGLKLSGGQRQRVAIARAIIQRPSLLIFDEATSALDNVTEQEIQENINALKTGAAVLVIAHRLSTVEDADQIIVLEDGKIAEIDAHQNLLARKGIYYALYYSNQDSSVAV